MFGGGQLGGSMAGSTVVERNLDRLTVIACMIFMFTTVLLALGSTDGTDRYEPLKRVLARAPKSLATWSSISPDIAGTRRSRIGGDAGSPPMQPTLVRPLVAAVRRGRRDRRDRGRHGLGWDDGRRRRGRGQGAAGRRSRSGAEEFPPVLNDMTPRGQRRVDRR